MNVIYRMSQRHVVPVYLSVRFGCSTVDFTDHFENMLMHSAKKALGIYAVHEVSENDGKHIHAIIHTTLTKSGYSQHMKKKFTMLDKGNWSIKDRYLEGDSLVNAERYLSKGEALGVLPDVRLNTLNVDVPLRHREYWEHYQRSRIQADVIPYPIEVVRERKKAKSIVQQVVDDLYIQHEGDRVKVWDYTSDEDRDEILECVLDRLGKSAKGLDAFIVNRIYNGVLNILCKRAFRDDMKNRVYRLQMTH